MPLENAIITSACISILWHLSLLNSEDKQEWEINEKFGLANKVFNMTPNLNSLCLIVQNEWNPFFIMSIYRLDFSWY